MRLDWTQPALDDLTAINSWLTANATGVIALRTLLEIRRRSRFLTNFPHGGRPDKTGVRVLRVFNTPYLILYRLLNDNIEILRVRHEREDWRVEP
jgi:toxin ParE1/3/4